MKCLRQGWRRLSIFVPDIAPPAGSFNHFLFTGDEPPLLFRL
jgi:hypothetical protein